MQRASDLPIEIVCDILRPAAQHAAIHDRSWLCALARTSRFVWILVRPILYETVTINWYNINSIVASVQSSNSSEHWRFTKNLRICIHTSLADAPALARALHRVQHVISDMEELEQLINGHAGFRPTRFTCTSMFYPMFWTRVFSSITHLHLATDGWNWAARGPPLPLPLEAALTHVVVQICPQFAAAVLPWFFASPTVQRVAVWEARWFRGTVHVPLDAFAKTHLDRRIRLIGDEERLPLVMTGDVQHPAQPDELDPSLPNLIYPYLPDVLTFDPALWEIGKELRW